MQVNYDFVKENNRLTTSRSLDRDFLYDLIFVKTFILTENSNLILNLKNVVFYIMYNIILTFKRRF